MAQTCHVLGLSKQTILTSVVRCFTQARGHPCAARTSHDLSSFSSHVLLLMVMLVVDQREGFNESRKALQQVI